MHWGLYNLVSIDAHWSFAENSGKFPKHSILELYILTAVENGERII